MWLKKNHLKQLVFPLLKNSFFNWPTFSPGILNSFLF